MKVLITLLLLGSSLFGKELVLWHAFEGFLAEQFAEIVEDFNHESGQFNVKLVNKGNYTEVFNRGVEAHQKGEQPAILQVYEVATQTMMLSPDLFYPVEDLMRSYCRKFDPDVYIDAVRAFYSTPEGKMYSLPWNASTGVLFYNKRLFEAVGLDPDMPPETWEELERVGVQLANHGYDGFVTAWPAAYHLEHVCAWHNKPFATYDNGYKGLRARLCFNHPFVVEHWEQLGRWQQAGIFSYQGRFTTEPEKHFADGRCGILLQGANRLPLLKRLTEDPIGVGFIPYWAKEPDAPYSLNIGGSSFWAMSGHDEETCRGIAQFFAYLSRPEVQAFWHQRTGYLPITEAAYYLSKKRGFYEQNPAAEIAILEVMHRPPTPYTKGVRLGDYTVIREKIIDYLEKSLNEEMTPQEALDCAVYEGNLLLEEFEKQHVSAIDDAV